MSELADRLRAVKAISVSWVANGYYRERDIPLDALAAVVEAADTYVETKHVSGDRVAIGWTHPAANGVKLQDALDALKKAMEE